MDVEEREKINRVLDLAEKNNKMIRKLYTAMQWSRAFKIFYWLILIGVAIGAFYYLQPFVEQIQSAYGGIQEGVQDLRDTFNEAEALKQNFR